MGILAEISFLVEVVADTHGADVSENFGLKSCIDVILEETSGSLNCTVPPATSEVITSVAIKAHQHVQLSAPVPPNLLLQAMKAAVQCMQVADGTVPAVSLVAMALLLCPGPAEEKKAYALMLIPNGMEEVSAAEVVEQIGASLNAGLHAAMAARAVAWATAGNNGQRATPARTHAVNALLTGMLNTAAVMMDEAPVNHESIDDLLNYAGQQLARVMPLMATKSPTKAAAGGRDVFDEAAASSALHETLWEYTRDQDAVAILVEEVRGPPFPSPNGHSSAIDIPSSSGSIMQARHESGRSRGSPAAAATSILSASSAPHYNMSARSSYDEGRSGHLHAVHARGSSSTHKVDLTDAGQLNCLLSTELEAARSSVLSSLNGAASPPDPLRSPQGGTVGASSPHVAGHFGGHFRGASAGSAGGPSSHTAFPARTDISLLTTAVPRVVEGSPGRRGVSAMPLSPGRVEQMHQRMGLTLSGSLSSGVGQASPVSAASAPQENTRQNHRHAGHAVEPPGAFSDAHLTSTNPATANMMHSTLAGTLATQPSASAGMSATLFSGGFAIDGVNGAAHTMHGNNAANTTSPRQLSSALAGAPAGLAPVATTSTSAPLQGGMSVFMGTSVRHIQGTTDDCDDVMNGVSLRADGGSIQVSAHDLMYTQRAESSQASGSMFRRFARNVPFMGSKYPSADVKEVQFFSAAHDKSNSSVAAATTSNTNSWTGRLGGPGPGASGNLRKQGGSQKGAAGGSMKSVASSGRLGGKLPVVPNQAIAMAAVTRPLTISAGCDKGSNSLPPSARTSRLLQDSSGTSMPFAPGLRPRAMSATNMHAASSTPPHANVYIPPPSPTHPSAAEGRSNSEQTSARPSAVHFAPDACAAAPLSSSASQPAGCNTFRHSWDGGALLLPDIAAQAASVPPRGAATRTPSIAESAGNLEAVFSSKVAQDRPTVHKLPRSTFDDSQEDCSSLIGSNLPRADAPDTASPLSVVQPPHPPGVCQGWPATGGSSVSASQLQHHSNTAQSSISLASAKHAAFTTQHSGSSASTPAHPTSVVSSATDVRTLHNRSSACDVSGVAAVSAADVQQAGLRGKATARSCATDSSPDVPYTPSNTAGPDSAATDAAAWANSTTAIGDVPPASAWISNAPSFQASMAGMHFGRVSDGSHARSSVSGLSDDAAGAAGRLYDRKNTFSFGTSAHAVMCATSTEAETADLLGGSLTGTRPIPAEIPRFEDTTDGALSATLAQEHRTPSSQPEGLKTRDPSSNSLHSKTSANQHVPATLSELSDSSIRSPLAAEAVGSGADSRSERRSGAGARTQSPSEGGGRRNNPPHAASAAVASPSSITSSSAPRKSPSFSNLASFSQTYTNAKDAAAAGVRSSANGTLTLSPNHSLPGTSPSSKLQEEASQASLHRVDTSASFRTAASGSSSFLNIDQFSSLLTLPRVATHQSTPVSLATPHSAAPSAHSTLAMPPGAQQQLFEMPAPPGERIYPPLNAVLPPPHSEASQLASPEIVHDEKEEVMDRVLVDMQLQVDLAAIATDNELRTQAQLNAITKTDADPVKAVATMAAVLGGKFFLLQGVRLILSVCLLVSSVAAFYALLEYAGLNVAISLAIVVGMNVTLAGILLLFIIMKSPSQGGLGQLLQNNQAGAASQSLQAVLPTFQPVIKQAARALGLPEDGVTPPATPPADVAPSPTSRAARATQQRRKSAHPRPQTAAERSANRMARSLPSIDPATVPTEPMVHALQRSSTPGTRVMFSSSVTGGNGNGNVLARVADTGAALMNRLPAKHRDSQVAKIATSLLQEIREFSAAQQNNGNNGQITRGSHGANTNGRGGQNGHRGEPWGYPVGESGGFHRSPNYERARAYSGPAAQVLSLTEISSEST